MALDSLPPSYACVLEEKPRVLAVAFGDGYSQRMADGINHIAAQWKLTWNAVTPADADTLCDYFRATGGTDAVTWTPPRESTEKKWIVTQWTRSPVQPGHDRITAVLKQVFDL